MTDRLAGQVETLPTQAPSRRSPGKTPPAGATDHSSADIVRIILRGLCGYESVSDICETEGVTRRDYNKWHREFLQACREWTRNDTRSHTQAGRGYFSRNDEQFGRLAVEQANDIIERADDRLTTAWLIEKRLAGRHFMDIAMP